MPLFDEAGERIRGRDNQPVAEAALSRVKLANAPESAEAPLAADQWLVANVCSEYIQYCQRGVANGAVSKSHLNGTVSFLNDLCRYCGAIHVVELKKGHITTWLQSHASWKSSATHRGVLLIVLAAFNHAEDMFSVASPFERTQETSIRGTAAIFFKARRAGALSALR